VTSPSDSPVPDGIGGPTPTALAATRTMMAAERTLMAWIRTALAMISFGFTIFKVLHGMAGAGAIHLRQPEEPRRIGLFLVALGTGSLLAGIVEYFHTLRQLSGPLRRPRTAFYVAIAAVVLGVFVLIELISIRAQI
jgi:putative membrane protein